jgi:hypothetical protein
MAYADYEFYATQYFGTAIAESDFPRLANKASAILDQLTFGRAATDTENTDALANAMCAVADEIYAIENSDGSEYITSESQGQYSVSYSKDAIEGRTSGQRYADAAKVWLANTGLLFAGFNTGEYGRIVDDS